MKGVADGTFGGSGPPEGGHGITRLTRTPRVPRQARLAGRFRPGTWPGARIFVSPGYGRTQPVAEYQSSRLSMAGFAWSSLGLAPPKC